MDIHKANDLSEAQRPTRGEQAPDAGTTGEADRPSSASTRPEEMLSMRGR